MSILDRISESRVDVRLVIMKKKFKICQDVYLEDVMRENPDYPLWLDIISESDDKMLCRLYDMLENFPGLDEVSTIYGLSYSLDKTHTPVNGLNLICFGIRGSARSVYGALRMIYGIVGIMKYVTDSRFSAVTVRWTDEGKRCKTFINNELFRVFHGCEHSTEYYKLYGEYLKVEDICRFTSKLTGRPLDSEGIKKTVKKCSSWYERTSARIQQNNDIGFSFHRENLLYSKMISSKV